MSVIWLMIPMALGLAGLAVWAFLAAVRSGQLDDLDTPAIRAVFDDDELPTSSTAAAAPTGGVGPASPVATNDSTTDS